MEKVNGSYNPATETILVAEDDASLRTLTKIVLESFGYTVISADDGEDAITKFMENRERISLALLDMIMPQKNGKEVSVAIIKVNLRIKVLLRVGIPWISSRPGNWRRTVLTSSSSPLSRKTFC